MSKLFILSGASGSGKSTLLDRLVKDGYCNAATKYAERKRFNTVDDVVPVENINDVNLKCDITYKMYGHRYGFSTQKIQMQLKESDVILITNDRVTIERLKEKFINCVVVVYIVSDINKKLLRQIYMERNGFPSMESITPQLYEELKKGELMVLHNDTEKFIDSIERLENYIDGLIIDEEEFSLRLNSIKNQEEIYCANSLIYDYIVLNLYSNNAPILPATKVAYEQLKKIITKETEEKND